MRTKRGSIMTDDFYCIETFFSCFCGNKLWVEDDEYPYICSECGATIDLLVNGRRYRRIDVDGWFIRDTTENNPPITEVVSKSILFLMRLNEWLGENENWDMNQEPPWYADMTEIIREGYPLVEEINTDE